MKLYKLPFVMHEPGAETEDKFMAEIPRPSRMQGHGGTRLPKLWKTSKASPPPSSNPMQTWETTCRWKLKRHRLKSRKILFSMRFWLRFELPNTHT